MELIDAGFYDGTVIHDYRSDRMVGGGYTYEDTENADYLNDLVSLADQYDALDLTPLCVGRFVVFRGAEYAVRRGRRRTGTT